MRRPRLPEEAAAWCAGRAWAPRALLLGYLAWAGLRHLLSGGYQDLFAGLNLGVHELGHVLFSGLGPFLTALGGTFWEIAVPVIGILMFVRQRDWFAIAVGGCWLSFAIHDVARYVADARRMELPLVGLATDPRHDWNYLLGELGLLPFDTALGFVLRILAVAVWGASVWFGAALLLEMRRSPAA